jgi:hypothetical protein
MLRSSLATSLVIACLLPGVCWADNVIDQKIDQIERDLEVARYQTLARIQADPQNQLASFVTDGCSGGLSDGWRFLAKTLPAFKRKFGNQPPYEACCVDHDRAYWRGETVHGYDKRLRADKSLQQCVLNYGKAHRAEFAAEFQLSPKIIEHNFHIVAALMYHAVRVGGGPCTPFAWRWGYGWPPCHAQDD